MHLIWSICGKCYYLQPKMFVPSTKRKLKNWTRFSSFFVFAIVFPVGLCSGLQLLLEICDLVCAAGCLNSSDPIYLWKVLINFLNPGVPSDLLGLAWFCQSFFTFFICRIVGLGYQVETEPVKTLYQSTWTQFHFSARSFVNGCNSYPLYCIGSSELRLPMA